MNGLRMDLEVCKKIKVNLIDTRRSTLVLMLTARNGCLAAGVDVPILRYKGFSRMLRSKGEKTRKELSFLSKKWMT